MNDSQIYTCSQMVQTIQDGETTLKYYPTFREFGLMILDGGSSFLEIHYCPFCGKSLPTSLRNEWFERLDALGLEPDDPSIPEEMHSDAWWQKEGL